MNTGELTKLNSSINNLPWNWHPDLIPKSRFPFSTMDKIENNFSQSWQDIFTLCMLNGKTQGSYLEIGGHTPINNNNTFLLSSKFNWHGITIEFDPSHLSQWLTKRPGDNFTITDALSINYHKAMPLWFGPNKNRIDYLQLDIDPSINTLSVLKKLPLNDYRFSVITFETDIYMGDSRARDESRAILSSHGYRLAAADVCVLFAPAGPNPIPFEDWWVDPQAIEKSKIEALSGDSFPHNLPQFTLFKGLQ